MSEKEFWMLTYLAATIAGDDPAEAYEKASAALGWLDLAFGEETQPEEH